MISRSAQDMAQLQAAKRAAERTQPSTATAMFTSPQAGVGPVGGGALTSAPRSTRVSLMPDSGGRTESVDAGGLQRAPTGAPTGRARAETSASRMMAMPWSGGDKQRSRDGNASDAASPDPAAATADSTPPSSGRKRQESRSWFGR